MKSFLNFIKEKFNIQKGRVKNKKFSFKKLMLLIISALITNLFSNFLGGILFFICGLYIVTKGIIPGIKKLGSQLVKFAKKQYNKIKKIEKEKKLSLFKSRKKNIEKEEKKEMKKIPNVIKNFKLLSYDKFKFNLKVKKDVNGCKIVNGSYRITGKDIIDSKTNFKYIKSNNETKTHEDVKKTYVKTR